DPATLGPKPRRPDRDDEGQAAARHDSGPDRGDEVVGLPQPAVVVRPDPARHPEEAEHVLRQEGEVEADEREPEMPFAEALVELAAEHLRPPVVEAAEGPDNRAAER